MFGTLIVMRPKEGHEQAVLDMMDSWVRERAPRIEGFVASVLYRNQDDPRELIEAVVFSSRDTYFANANDPEQDRWYWQLVEHLESEPRFIDGDVLGIWR